MQRDGSLVGKRQFEAMTDGDHIDAIAEAFSVFIGQLELGDHRDAEDHQVLRNHRLAELRDAIAQASPASDVVSMDDARALARQIADDRAARER